jgi:hypothetical protein
VILDFINLDRDRRVARETDIAWNRMNITPRYVCFRSWPVGMSSAERRWRCHLMALLREQLTGDTREANNYRKHTWEYNSAVAFASMGAEIKSPPGNGQHCFRIQGQIYHLVSPLYSTKQLSQDMDNFIFSILLKQQQNGRKTNQTKNVWLKQCNDWARCCDKLNHLLSHINKWIK